MDAQDIFWDGEFKTLRGTQNKKLSSVGYKAKAKSCRLKMNVNI